jgi:hypothetical protein
MVYIGKLPMQNGDNEVKEWKMLNFDNDVPGKKGERGNLMFISGAYCPGAVSASRRRTASS